MCFRSVFITFSVWLLFLPAAIAQKRILSTVNPNEDTFNMSADLYVPSGGGFVSTAGALLEPREEQTAVRLLDGRVLVAGGKNNRYLKSAEIYNPSTGTFTKNYQTTTSPVTGLVTVSEGTMNTARSGAGSVLLLDGSVLVAGGYNGSYLSQAEIYDPDTGTFSYTTGVMTDTRYHPTSTLLEDGRVLITGGVNSVFLNTTEIYNSFTGYFSQTSDMSVARSGHTATLLNDGRVLIVGGCSNAEVNKIVCDNYLSHAEIYDPIEDTFEETGSLNTARAEHSATLLPDGRVLIAGGTDGENLLATSEIFDPETDTFTYSGSMALPRKGQTATTLNNGNILLAGGYSDGYLDSAEVYDTASGTFSVVASLMSAPRMYHTATALQDGRILLAGGLNTDPLLFDVNIRTTSDNVSPNIVFTSDSQIGFVPYTGSGVIVAFSTTTGEVIGRIVTGGKPTFMTPIPGTRLMAVVSVLDNRIFIVATDTLSLVDTYVFQDAFFGFGSILTLSPDGTRGYISSTGTGEVIKFDIATGNEFIRLDGLDSPAQITVTPDGNTILVVDTQTAEVYFIDTASMATRFIMTPRNEYELAGFTIYNKPVLDSEGIHGIICSRDIDDAETNALFVFRTADGVITDKFLIGNKPGFTALTPDNTQWMILSTESITLLPVNYVDEIEDENDEPGVSVEMPTAPLGSANIVFSADSKYAFFADSLNDRILQFDLETHSIVGSYQVGDIISSSQEQPVGIAITPDEQVVSVVNLVSNELDLFVDVTMLKMPGFINDRDQFTGITLINLSDSPANITVRPYNNSGGNSFYREDSVSLQKIDPVSLPPLYPNEQYSLDLSQIFGFNNIQSNEGHLEITSDQPDVVGYGFSGRLGTTFLEPRLTSLNGTGMYRFPERLYDWISPELSLEEQIESGVAITEFRFTNPNFSTIGYEIIHYGSDGAQLEGNDSGEMDAVMRSIETQSSLFSDTIVNNVLIAGGRGDYAYPWAEIFSPDDLDFSFSGSMGDARYGHTASLMATGEVLVAGGRDGVHVLDTAEVYDPIKNYFFDITGTMFHERYRHTSTALNDGTVLIAGGQNSVSINATAEIFDPVTEIFSETAGEMNSPRDAHTATLLSNGRVLLAGGIDGIGLSHTAEIYDPATSTFTSTGSMNVGRAFHKAVRLQDGRVLITGGYNGEYLDSAEIYDPGTGTFTEIAPMNEARSDHTATLLPDGTVLITGGVNSSGVLDTAEFFFPQVEQFVLMPRTMTEPRSQHTATLLPDGLVLLVSGTDGEDVLANSEMYYPESQAFSKITATQTAQREHTATLLRDLIAGYLRGASEQGVMFRQITGPAIKRVGIGGIDVDRYEGVTATYSPYFDTVSPSRTILNLINANDEEDAVVTVTLHGFDGSVLGTPVVLELPMNHQINKNLTDLFQNDSEILEQRGWIEVSSSVDRVVGTVSLGQIGGNILATFELSVLPLDEFIIPLSSENGDYITELSLLNTSSQSADVQIELWSGSGILDYPAQTVSLPPNTSIDGFLSDYFSMEFDRLYGYIRVRSSQPIHGNAVLWGRDMDYACPMPPIPIPEP